MKYELINKDIESKSLLNVVMDNRNITKEQVERLLNANEEEYRNPFEIENMDRAVECFRKIYKEDLVIGLLIDSDVDGFTSSALLYQWLRDDLKHPIDNIKVFHHLQAKAHGLNTDIFEEMLNSNVDLFIIADSSTNDKEQQKQLSEKGKNAILLDHHICEDYEEISNVFIVNNQLGDKSNSHLSGVGVAGKFVEALGYDISKYTDLIAVGQIADGMEQLDYQNRSYVNNGLSNIKNPLIQAYFNKNRIAKPVLNDVSFSLANFINAVVRVGTLEEKQLMFRALTGEQEEFDYTKKDGTVIKETLQERVVRISSNCKSRQNNGVKKSVELCNKYITRNKIGGDKVIVIKNENMIEPNTVGLVCMRLADNHRRPCIIVTEFENGECIGSIRAIDGVENFKDTLEETNLCNWVRGHQPAAGISINKDNIIELRKVLNNKFKNFKFSDGRIYKVDDIIEVNNLNKQDIVDIGKLKPLWCSTCRESMFVIKNIKIDSVKIKMVGRLTLEFEANGIKFRKNWCSKDFFEEISGKNIKHFGKSIPLNITLVGKFSLDSKGNPFVEIVDANTVKNTQVIF